MPLTIKSDNNKTLFEFENTVSIWNILKYLVDTPYLKHFIIENYDGGNTLVPPETWDEEGIMYKKLPDNAYFFPYDSIGFIIDDSIHNIDLYVVELFQEGTDYGSQSDLVFSIRDTDNARLIIPEEKTVTFLALYLLSVMKIGFDKTFLNALENIFNNIFNAKITDIEYIPASITTNLKKLSFLLKIDQTESKPVYYRISYSNKKCRKEILKEEDIKNLGFLKKKIEKKNKWVPFAIYGLITIICVLLFVFNKKILIAGLVIIILTRFVIYLFKKNAVNLLLKNK